MVGDWYAREMYIQGHPSYEHHVKHYGHPSEFGYKDILPLWKAEKFEPAELIRFYQEAGARYFTTCAVHHDNFDCWNSVHHKWNSVNIGPKKDIVGMWEKEVRKIGMRFGVTEHHERSYSWFNTNKGSDSDGELKGVPYDGANPEYQDYYYEHHPDTSHEYPQNPSEAFIRNWYDRITDVIDQYQPDLLYTDGGVPFGEYGRKLLAHYYNKSLEWNNGDLSAVYNYKDGTMYPSTNERDYHLENLYGDYVDGVGVLDMERGVVDDIHPEPWQTDTCIGKWYYQKNVTYKTPTEVIRMLVDIVSKNGNLLLNVPLKPDGTLDDQEIQVVEGIGAWLKVNGEAIYETRPWTSFGEGPTRAQSGHMQEKKALTYTPEDFRFTRKDDVVYAIGMCRPREGDAITIHSLDSASGYQVQSLELLGSSKPVPWQQGYEGLRFTLPSSLPVPPCYSLKIQL